MTEEVSRDTKQVLKRLQAGPTTYCIVPCPLSVSVPATTPGEIDAKSTLTPCPRREQNSRDFHQSFWPMSLSTLSNRTCLALPHWSTTYGMTLQLTTGQLTPYTSTQRKTSRPLAHGSLYTAPLSQTSALVSQRISPSLYRRSAAPSHLTWATCNTSSSMCRTPCISQGTSLLLGRAFGWPPGCTHWYSAQQGFQGCPGHL